MSGQTFPVFVDQPGCIMRNFSIDGNAVGAIPGSDGLDGRGKFLCKISKTAGTFTIEWLNAFAERPYVFFQAAPGTGESFAPDIITSTAKTLVYTTNTTASFDVLVCGYNTTSFVS